MKQLNIFRNKYPNTIIAKMGKVAFKLKNKFSMVLLLLPNYYIHDPIEPT